MLRPQTALLQYPIVRSCSCVERHRPTIWWVLNEVHGYIAQVFVTSPTEQKIEEAFVNVMLSNRADN